MPNGAVQLVTTRDVIPQLLALDRHIDLVIPRGSNELVRYIKSSTKIPVLGHADGLCSIFLEESADAKLAAGVLVDSKTSYPAACNALETLLVQESALESILPGVAEKLIAALQRAGGHASWCEDVQERRWYKLLLNAAWNPICALTLSRDVGFLSAAGEPLAEEILIGVMREVVALAQAQGYAAVTEEAGWTQLERAKGRWVRKVSSRACWWMCCAGGERRWRRGNLRLLLARPRGTRRGNGLVFFHKVPGENALLFSTRVVNVFSTIPVVIFHFGDGYYLANVEGQVVIMAGSVLEESLHLERHGSHGASRR